SANRRVRVRPEVEPVVAKDALEQQLDLDPFQVRVVRDGWTFEGASIAQRYSHTRMRLNSCSVSTGLVMESDAPASMHSSRSPFMAFAVSAMIGRLRNFCRSRMARV